MKALISVFKKDGIEDFAKGLAELGVEIFSTGGTLKRLNEVGVKVESVTELTHYPEIMDGRVKTLNPNIHGGILAKRDNKEHMDTVKELNIPLIDIVVVNLYPFEETIAKPGVSLDEIIEMIDIGGPTMIRSAAKNFMDVIVLVNPARYPEVLAELRETGKVSVKLRQRLALEAFSHTARYDSVISSYFAPIFANDELFLEEMSFGLTRSQILRYGENSHQQAALYQLGSPSGLLNIEQLQGKEMSFNNYLDTSAAYSMCKRFMEPCAVIVKHTNPCGAAVAEDIVEAYNKAYAADSVSAFGGIVALNRECDGATATEIAKIFVEVIIAPSFSEEAVKIFSEKKNLRLLAKEDFYEDIGEFDVRKVDGGILVQEKDIDPTTADDWKSVTDRQPTEREIHDMEIGWNILPTVKSNAIILVKDGVLVGVGAGQMSRVEATELAIKRAGDKAKGSVLASDAFFPFGDSLELAAKAGITAVIQPGGSVKDEESVKVCNDNKMAMLVTGIRHFKH